MNRSAFSIATFNLYNLNLPGLRMYRNAAGWSKQEFEAKVSWTARMLTELDADIVGLQELWHREALLAVLERAGVAEDYDVLAEPAVGTGIVTAALVRKGLLVQESAQWIARFPDDFILRSGKEDAQTPEISVRVSGFSRPVLNFQVALRKDEPATHVYVCHLKSKVPAPISRESWYDKDRHGKHAIALGSSLSTIRRTAEGTALRMILTEVMKGTVTPVLVMGDVNDGQHSNTANILTGQPRYLVGDSRGGGDIALYTGQTLQEYRDTRDVYYTHVYEDLRESLDHILVSEQFYDNSLRRRWLFDGLTIANDHLNDDEHKAKGSGDHGIVRVHFRHRPWRA